MSGVTLNSNASITGANALQSDDNLSKLTGLDALRAQPSFTFAGAQSDLNDYTPPARPGILDKNYDSQGRYIGNGAEGPFSILNEPGWDPQGDYDGDGIENQDEQIIVSGPPRMKTQFSELSLLEKAQWSAIALASGSLAADLSLCTDITGDNPDNPYISEEESHNRFEKGMTEPPPPSSGR
jgi:hypothetical protein